MRARTVKLLLAAASLAAVCAASTGRSSRAEAQPAAAPAADPVVARVGDRVITAREVERRLAQIPPFQLQSLGRTPEEIRKNFVSQVLARELLLAQGAVAQKLIERPDVQDRIRSVLRAALLQQVEAEAAASSPVTDEEVRAYYEAHRDKFSSPAMVALWRILVGTREEAEAILAELKKDPSPQRFKDLARDKSLDKATSMRGGDLGFVAPDGATAEPGLKVSPALLEAAARVKDAELVPEPVPEGDRFAVVWRRQSRRPVSRTLEQEAPSIRQILAHGKAEARVKQLLERLRAQDLSGHAPELVDLVDVTSTGDLQALRRPGSLPSSRRPGAPPPSPVPRHDMR
ncbi:peptidyl-prolyl cis-trans isomerase [Sorangium cellulosum]|uniref:Peptidyl-prolyl cis-trans isomerase n=1 Tax=Sorangium cellulosum TaxID=56 RepID=A0A2L0END9_SORCE|nr:peptidyl-prolyl cis-trans isomerase [Sorangium cellulosum]AUX40806.1 peptidyl-prolyl cis-trans isomerase [Sorangium cellulosum]